MNLRSVATVVALASLIAGCGDDSSQSGAADPDPTPTTDDVIGEPGPYPMADLTIEYHNDETGATYRLSCQGDTSALSDDAVDVDDRAACTALADNAVVSRLIDGLPTDRVCTEIYGGADVATIIGTIDDQTVNTTASRENGCAIDDWDTVLVDLLPPPKGA